MGGEAWWVGMGGDDEASPSRGGQEEGGLVGVGEFLDFGVDVVGAQEGFADEDGIGAAGFHEAGVALGFDAAFGDKDELIGDLFAEVVSGLEVDFEGFEVAIVDANDLGVGVEGAIEFFAIVDFDEDIELEGLRFLEKIEVSFLIEGGDDEEDGVGSGDDGFVDLGFVDDEIFPEDGDIDGLFDLGEEGEVALKVFFVGEDGDGAGAGVGVGFGDEDGIEAGGDGAGRGGGLFDFGDDVEGFFRVFAFEGVEEGAEVIAFGGGESKFLGEGEEGFDFGAFVGDDFVEFVHGDGDFGAGGEGGSLSTN
jgi:hypothetical protein